MVKDALQPERVTGPYITRSYEGAEAAESIVVWMQHMATQPIAEAGTTPVDRGGEAGKTMPAVRVHVVIVLVIVARRVTVDRGEEAAETIAVVRLQLCVVIPITQAGRPIVGWDEEAAEARAAYNGVERRMTYR